MERRFVTVDVFAKERFGGNQLAVVLDAEGLETAQMQAIAHEFNYAETTFILPPKDHANTAEVRIFTPKAEMPFAGHPNVGTAFVLAREGAAFGKPITGGKVVFEEKAGLVLIDILTEDSAVIGARLQAPKAFTRGESFDPAQVAEGVSLPSNTLTLSEHAPVLVDGGVPFLIAQVESVEALNAAAPNAPLISKLLNHLTIGIYLYATDGKDGVNYQTRMFAPDLGVLEDAATGSATVALVGLLASLDPMQDCTIQKIFLQGVKLGRPRYLEASATKSGGKVTATFVGGRCVPIMRGVLLD